MTFSGYTEGAPLSPTYLTGKANELLATASSSDVDVVPVFYVLDPKYSLDSTGKADSAASLRKMISDATNAGGGIIQFSAGSFLMASVVTLGSFVRLEGVAPDYLQTGAGTILTSPGNSYFTGLPMLDVSGTNWVAIRNVKLIMAGNNSAFNTAIGIGTPSSGAGFLEIDKCHIQWFGGSCMSLAGGVHWITRNRGNNNNGFFLYHSGTDSFIAFNESGAHQSNGSVAGVNGFDAIRINGGGMHSIVNNQLYNHANGIHLSGGAPYGNRIEGNRCEKHGEAGIRLNAAINNLVLGNHCFNNGYNVPIKASGIGLVGGSRANTVVGNRCENVNASAGSTNQQYGILIDNAGSAQNLVGSNYCYSSVSDGIRITGSASSNQIIGNSISSCQRYGIQIDGTVAEGSCDGNIVAANAIDNTGLAADNVHDAIILTQQCGDTAIRDNTIRTTGSAQARYAIRVNASSCSSTWIVGNDVRNGWKTSPGVSDVGTNTIMQDNYRTQSARAGKATLSAGAINVVTAEVVTGDNVVLSIVSIGAVTPGVVYVAGITSGTSFAISSTSAGDTSTIYWEIVH